MESNTTTEMKDGFDSQMTKRILPSGLGSIKQTTLYGARATTKSPDMRGSPKIWN